jgi:hypothetical protein
MDLGPSVVSVVDERSRDDNMLALLWKLDCREVVAAGAFRLLESGRMGAHDFHHEVASLFLEVLFVGETFLACVEMKKHVLVAVIIGVDL